MPVEAPDGTEAVCVAATIVCDAPPVSEATRIVSGGGGDRSPRTAGDNGGLSTRRTPSPCAHTSPSGTGGELDADADDELCALAPVLNRFRSLSCSAKDFTGKNDALHECLHLGTFPLTRKVYFNALYHRLAHDGPECSHDTNSVSQNAP